tara:strand:+ start:1189 stop:1617 length:429 start_codon:yes stop_codon:yes gene_type:complete
MKLFLPSPVLLLLLVFSLNSTIVSAKDKWIFTSETLKVLPDGSVEKTGLKYYWRPISCNDNNCTYQTLYSNEYYKRRNTHELLCEKKLSRIIFEERKLRTERRFKPVEIINKVLPSIWYDFESDSVAKIPYKSMCNKNLSMN